jgi:predicted O-methyltransferase YrrM
VHLRRLVRACSRPVDDAEADDVAACEAVRAWLLADQTPVGDVFEAQGGGLTTTVAAEAAIASSPPEKAVVLYRLVRHLQPRVVVELGGALGLSGCYLATALQRNGRGRLVSVEGSPSRAAVAAQAVSSVAPGVSEHRVSLFDDALGALDGADLLFNDGNHFAEAVLRYGDEARRRMARPALVVVDDIRDYSPEMTLAWDQLRRSGQSAEIGSLGLLRLT